ncbi:MmgE/PrpD family protein [Ovoidimarina sediminis]|uniref:MmgE/PrpD family protein n=1 Tax=Ovoidimarina sediminis TaxID=3079856 RepID=UPI002907C7A2|nr:MmgE/PrpD family protein [Rhodophyticola sp. MJ-SS7]MDU8945853.1 MmgE/PrpD family protein [Rhodophyticola sp. MJ-SS7]
MSLATGADVGFGVAVKGRNAQAQVMTPIEAIHDLSWSDLPENVRTQAKRCLLDLLGVGAAGAGTELSRIIRAHAAAQFGGQGPIAFDSRRASPAGAALALGMTIDAVDGHDGYNPAKGHIGCGLVPAAWAIATDLAQDDGREFLTTLVLGYELGARLAVTLHATAGDYHTSGAWVAPAAAAAGARLMRLSQNATAHAVGIAEYHGPRSQMMRCIDHPTMVKDGSGWGAMAGVSAAYLARDGFTGAPALTFEGPAWADLGQRWLILEQYFKPYPVCRWAQPPVEAALSLLRDHKLRPSEITALHVETFHESTRLAVSHPRNTEEAQYSTSFPVAVALARGRITPEDLQGEALTDPEILRLSAALEMTEHDHANRNFPSGRFARVTLTLADGRKVSSDWHSPKWDAAAPPSDAELTEKFHAMATPSLGPDGANRLFTAIHDVDSAGLRPLTEALAQPIISETTRGSAA